MLTRKELREKAERTTSAAVEIIQSEKAASEAKTARLKALRAAQEDASADTAAEGGRGHRGLTGPA